MTQDLSQYLESSRSVTILILNVTISVISLQSAISSSPRGVTSSYFTCIPNRAECCVSGLQSAPRTPEVTPKPHKVRAFWLTKIPEILTTSDPDLVRWFGILAPRNDSESTPHERLIRQKSILAPFLLKIHSNRPKFKTHSKFTRNRKDEFHGIIR